RASIRSVRSSRTAASTSSSATSRRRSATSGATAATPCIPSPTRKSTTSSTSPDVHAASTTGPSGGWSTRPTPPRGPSRATIRSSSSGSSARCTRSTDHAPAGLPSTPSGRVRDGSTVEGDEGAATLPVSWAWSHPSCRVENGIHEGGTGMIDEESLDTLRGDLRTAWHRYIDVLVPLRPALYGYWRRLTGNVWDAEDLVQDTLLRAFGQWGVTYPAIRNPRAYLLRTATNVWIDILRRRETE